MMSKFTPSSESVLIALKVEPTFIKSVEPHWKRTHYRAAINWLTKYKPQLEASHLEQVRGYIEAFHHLCEVEDWGRANAILCITLNTPTRQVLHEQLGTWGYYREQINIYFKLLGKVKPEINSICLNGLGNAYCCLGDYFRAIYCYRKSLQYVQSVGDRHSQCVVLGNLGSVYEKLGNISQAIHHYKQQHEVALRSSDFRGDEGNALMNLGSAYKTLADYPQAIEHTHKALMISQEVSDYITQAKALANLGSVY